MKSPIVVCLLLLVLILPACSSFTQPTPIPTGTFTVAPTLTATLMPTRTPLPPTETSATASEWNGIPIIPGAAAGDGDEEGYVFTIKATPQQVREYYELEMGKLGWRSSVEGDGVTSLTLTFTNDVSETITMNVIAKDDEVLVILVK